MPYVIINIAGSGTPYKEQDGTVGSESGSITNTQLLNAFKSTKTAKHTDTSSFDNALEMSLSLLEQFKTLNIENNTTVI